MWHVAAYLGNLEVLETIWSWANEVKLRPFELLLAQTERGRTVLHMAAEKNHAELIQKL